MFPTVVLGTLNAVMTPIVQGVATMLEGEKLDMQQYREQKDKLEYEAMKRIPKPPTSSATRNLTSNWRNWAGRPVTL